ncbi:MAG: response regulator [Prochloron sp. SP5CPC1]|nr:response regulator [Candidatus Paraprochloron terpiosi SP5CPC1]
MIEDPKIREEVHTYFLSEAQELLNLIEQKLLTFQEDHSKATVHEIIRAAHTIKGGAANLELETITAVAHSLEDIFQSLYNPDLVIDSELHSLLLEAYECLRLPVMAEITKSKIDKEEVLERSAAVFAKLQAILGDSFGNQSHIPSSEELGFDVTQSIFEKGVKERLEKIAAAIARGNVGEVEATLREQAEVFVGLGESLNLPGFREIATTILTALDTPNAEVMEIASVALADLQRARDAVLRGDRSRGVEPSAMLQQIETEKGGVLPYIRELYPKSLQQERSDLAHFIAGGDSKSNTKPLKPHAVQSYLRAIDYILGWFYHELAIPINNLSLELLVAREEQEVIVVDTDLDYIKAWLGKFRQFIQDEGESKSLELYRYWWILSALLLVAKFKADLSIIKSHSQRIKQIAKQYQQFPPLSKDEKQQLESGKLQNLLVDRNDRREEEILEQIWGGDNLSLSETLGDKIEESQEIGEEEKEVTVEEIPATIEKNDHVKQENNITQYVQVEVRELQRLNYLTGELLINQNRQALQEEKIKVAVQELFSCLEQHKQTLNQLKYNKASQIENNEIATVKKGNFDALELDRYTDFHLQLHTALQETAKLEKATSAINWLTNEQFITFEKQQRLLSSVRDDLQEAQMIPLGNLLNSFPDMIAKLAKVYGKLVDFRITGSQVLVDKAIGEKLYAPLLQLVRNAFDHGIESTEIRREKGKEERGLIGIYGYHQGSQAIIEVRDDGSGLNFEKIRRRGMEMGLVPDGGTVPTQEELTALLFQPGFSTAAKVSEISGRGMGLDIVRSQIEALQGSVKVQPNVYGGTTFILQIPFSMTTAKLLVIRAGDHVYALLLETIEKIILPNAAQRAQIEESQVFYWGTGDNSELLRVRKISDFMHYNRSANGVLQEKKKLLNKAAPLLLLRGETKLIALEVDEIIAEQELVIRPVGKTIAPPPYVCGCTVLGDGGLALVIDSGVLVQLQEQQEESTTRRVLPQQPQYFLTPSPGEPKEELKRLQPRNLKRVLVVDDAMSIRQTLTLTLEKHGYQVFRAADGVEALEQLHHSPGVSLMVCDLEMPRMNGFEVLSHLSSDPALSKIPVVILTSRQSEKHRRLAEELGAIAYFTKPYSEAELLTTISELIEGGG